jgi:hypothetical protein
MPCAAPQAATMSDLDHYVATLFPYDGNPVVLEREKANAKRRIHGYWQDKLPVDVSDVEVVSITTRDIDGQTEATMTFRLIE